jgi:hypothetical protein
LLLVVDLAQIQHGALHGSEAGQTAILHHAEVAVNPVILFSLSAAQKHGEAAACQKSRQKKRGRSLH